MRSYAQTVAALEAVGLPLRELRGARCFAAVTLPGARLIALAFDEHAPNLLWTHPDLGDTERVRDHMDTLAGGIGGDRLWFAPEPRFHWDGEPDWASFSNYSVPVEIDPGAYSFGAFAGDAVSLRSDIRLATRDGSPEAGFTVERTTQLTPPPIDRHDFLMSGDYAGVETRHLLKLADDARAGRVDLWHLLQVAPGSTLIVPLRPGHDPVPLAYGLPGSWEHKGDHIAWTYRGTENAKFGLPAATLTGRSGVLRSLGQDRWCLIVRDFAADPAAIYADHPYGAPREDQLFQAWDGFGFGEMEFHSPALDASSGPRELTTTDRIWAFGADRWPIAGIARRLLGVDISHALDAEPAQGSRSA